MKHLDLLIHLAKFGKKEHCTTTVSLSKEFGMSQQSISRILKGFESRGLISRSAGVDGISIKLSSKAMDHLKEKYVVLKNLLEKQQLSIRGKLYSGLGEGKFYTQVQGYRKQFIESLKIDPFPGTLNLRVDEMEKSCFLANRKPVRLEGFVTKDRSFGGIDAYPVKIKSVDCAVVVPERTIHSGTLEVISGTNLRKHLNLKDNDEVEVL